MIVDGAQIGFVAFALGQFGIELAEAGLQSLALALVLLIADPSHALELVIAPQAKDSPEDFLALPSVFLGELVGTPLDDEGRVDEGVVVHGEELVDAPLGGINTLAFTESAEDAVAFYL